MRLYSNYSKTKNAIIHGMTRNGDQIHRQCEKASEVIPESHRYKKLEKISFSMDLVTLPLIW